MVERHYIASNYYPFGSVMQTRNLAASSYRYGFNGKEKDNEINVDEGNYDFGARVYDIRLGRWLGCDKLFMLAPSWSLYRSFFDNPIYWTDPDGNLEWPLKGSKAGNKKDGAGGSGTIVRTSTYQESRTVGTNPHIGIDYRASIGTPVYSIADGTISGMYTTKKGIIILVVSYGDGDKFRFLHLSEYASGLKVGDKVREGQIIAYSGNSGGYPAHLHLDAKDKNGNSIDPENKNYGKMTNEEFFGGTSATPSSSSTVSVSLTTSVFIMSPLAAEAVDATGVAKSYLEKSPFNSPKNTTNLTVTASSLNLRTGAGTNFETIGIALEKGTKLTGTGNTNGNWSEVKTSDGRTGWVNSKYVTKSN